MECYCPHALTVFPVFLLYTLQVAQVGVPIHNINSLCHQDTHTCTHIQLLEGAGCTLHCLQSFVMFLANNQTVGDWALASEPHNGFLPHLTCLTLPYSKPIKPPQVSYLSVCFTKTSSTQVLPNLVSQFIHSSWVTSGICAEKCFSCNLYHSEQSH